MRRLTVKSSLELSAAQKQRLEKAILAKEKEEILFAYVADKNISGIMIFDGEKLLDVSASHRLAGLKKNVDDFLIGLQSGVAIKDIPDLIKSKLKDFSPAEADFRVSGRVTAAADGIVHIEGLSNCEYGEIVLIGDRGFALAMNLEEDSIGAILLSGKETAQYGDLVFATGNIVEVPVGYEFLGRVIDPLGNPVDGRPQIIAKAHRTVENAAPRIVDRDKVNSPLQTGILAIDSMIPVGKGQRELIIGDMQTGKTSIAVDTIINQKDKNVICVYVAIGQRASSVNRLVKTLEQHGAMEYTTVVLSTASDMASVQYIAPYTGTALAEFFMYDGRDVLIVYDDLSKHAVAYRTISLLLKRPAGREAYPGDIFYIHSRLLERAAKLSPALGGGSITALPIVETQAGDISAYIPTNIISITDGQIYLEKELFNAGQRPAINVGLSVSRVGGSAQTKLMRKLCSNLRLKIAHYRELAVFAQFVSSLDTITRETLESGKKIEEAIRQSELMPYPFLTEIIYLFAINGRLLNGIPQAEVRGFIESLADYIMTDKPELCSKITNMGELSDEDMGILAASAESFVSMYSEAKEAK